MTSKVLIIGGQGRTGRLIAGELSAAGVESLAMGRHADPGDPHAVAGSITSREDLALAVAGTGVDAAVIVVESGGGANDADAVHHRGVVNAIDALPAEAPIVLITQIYITRADSYPASRDVIVARGRGEQALRQSTHPYMIVRPGWLTNAPARSAALRLEQGDSGEGDVSRGDVARVVAAALTGNEAQRCTFELFNQPGDAQLSLASAFRALVRDAR